jgi:hypothetical protein
MSSRKLFVEPKVGRTKGGIGWATSFFCWKIMWWRGIFPRFFVVLLHRNKKVGPAGGMAVKDAPNKVF